MMQDARRLAQVMVFTRQLLPYSQTFVREQALALQRWQPTLVGLQALSELDHAPLPSLTLDPSGHGWLLRARRAWRDWWWLADPAHVTCLRPRGFMMIHAHFGTGGVCCWPLARALGLPLLVTLHGYDVAVDSAWWEAGRGGWINRRYPQRLRRLAAAGVHFLAVSQRIRAQAIRLGIPARQITLHHIGVDTERFRASGAPLPQRPRRILFVGRLVEKKGCEILLQALAILRATIPGVELRVVGDGPLGASLRRNAAQLRLPAQFLGALPHAAVRANLDEARVLCAPSLQASNGDAEGLPMVILEAAAMGVPVVTSASLAHGEGVLDGRTGYLCAQRDAAALAERLARILLDDSLANSMSAAAVTLMRERFDLRACTRTLERIYDAIVSGAVGVPERAAVQSA
jgi:glycosyltransferase involved in cell wall biosynthesis